MGALERFVEVGDVLSEASALVMQAKVYMQGDMLKQSLSAARQGLILFQEEKNEKGEALANEVLDQLRGFEFRVDERYIEGPGPEAIEGMPRRGGPQVTSLQAIEEVTKQLDRNNVIDTIQSVTKKMVGSTEDVALDNPLMDIGITSMNAVLFRNKLGGEFEGVDLPVTLVFDYPTIRGLVDIVLDRSRD